MLVELRVELTMLPVLQRLGDAYGFKFSTSIVTSAVMASGGRDPQGQMSQIQRQIQQDWANREYIELMTCSIKKITDFLNAFGMYQLNSRSIYGRRC